MRVGLNLYVLAPVNLRTAPGTAEELGRGAARPTVRAVVFLYGLLGILGGVRGCPLSNPEADAERLRPPPRVALLDGLAPDGFAGADKRRGALELLEGQEPKRVAHEDGDAALAGSPCYGALKTP